MGSGRGGEEEIKVERERTTMSPQSIRKYAIFSFSALVMVALYLLTHEKRTEDEMMLSKVYESKYRDLEALLAEKDAALNETYAALEKTHGANKLQEEAVKDLQLKVSMHQRELDRVNGVEGKLNSEVIKTTFLAEDKKQAEMTVQMCRQEAAAALQEKELQIMQHQQALERAREDVEELQRAMKLREAEHVTTGFSHSNTHKEMTHTLGACQKALADRERSLNWVVEKKRQDNERHVEAVKLAKTERDCHSDIEILRGELNKVLSKQRQTDLVKDIKKRHADHPSTGSWQKSTQLPQVIGHDGAAFGGEESSKKAKASSSSSKAPAASASSSSSSKSQNAYLTAKSG